MLFLGVHMCCVSAGKTQLAQQLERMGWAVVGSVQQTLQASEEACIRALSNGQNVVASDW